MRYCADYISKNKVFPNYKILTNKFNTTQQDISNTFKILEFEGKIKRNVGYRTVDAAKLNIVNKKINNKLVIFKFVVLMLSILSIYLSVHYNYIYFLNTINDKLISFIMALVIVGSIVTIFEMSLFYSGTVRIILLLISMLLLLFNITIITAGQYETYIKNTDSKENINIDDVKDNIQNIEKQIYSNNITMNELNKEKSRLDSIKYSFDSVEEQKKNINIIRSVNRQISTCNYELDRLFKLNTNLINQKLQINKEYVIFDFFVFVGTLNKHINSEVLRFIILIFPSVLFDIISCIGFVFVLNKEDI